MLALRIIREEHQTLAAVMHGLQYLVRGIRNGHAGPDFALLGAMIYYIDTFPERLHHPKEDAWLFRILLLRHPPARPLLERLQEEHRAGGTQLKQLEQCLMRYQAGGSDEFPAFAAAVDSYVAFERNHMRTEEKDVIPLAQQYLTSADWQEIDAAFCENTDPLQGEAVSDDFRDLFRRIVNLAPPPIGVGPIPA